MRVFSFLRGHKIFKAIGLILAALIAAFVVLVLVTAFRSWWSGYQWQKKADKFQAALEKPYREDLYGGKTPEETWAMFLSALKQGDVEEASRYVAVDKREKYRVNLEKAKEEDRLEQRIKNMEGLKKDPTTDSSESEAYYYYDYFNSEFKQTLSSSVVFYLNPYTKVWKILVL